MFLAFFFEPDIFQLLIYSHTPTASSIISLRSPTISVAESRVMSHILFRQVLRESKFREILFADMSPPRRHQRGSTDDLTVTDD